MTVLSDKWIKKMVKDHSMISPFEEEYPVINHRFLDSFSDSLAKNFVPILSPETILLITFL